MADYQNLIGQRGELSREHEIELALLMALHNSKAPVGAVALSFELQHVGGISQASIGRKLKEFDVRGLTERVGYQGRNLTQAGEEYLRDSLTSAVTVRRNKAFLETLNANDADTLIQVLEARRALEKECARLATIRMSEDDVDKLYGLIENQRQQILSGQSGSYENIAFHEMVAQLAKNDVLVEALRLVRSKSQLTILLDTIREQVGSVLVRDHQEIVAAMVARNPDLAEQAMAAHLDRLIADVRKFFGMSSDVQGS